MSPGKSERPWPGPYPYPTTGGPDIVVIHEPGKPPRVVKQ